MHRMTSSALQSIAYTSRGNLRALWRLTAFASAFFLIVAVVDAMAQQVAGFSSTSALSAETVQEFVLAISALTAIGVVVRFVDNESWSIVALDKPTWRRDKILNGATLGMLAIATTAALLFALQSLRIEFPASNTPNQSSLQTWLVSAAGISIMLAPAALFEELIFRGYLWRVTEDATNSSVALMVTSFVFGLSHLQNAGAGALSIFNVMLAGVALGLVRQVSNSVPAAWAAHFAWNWMMAVALHGPVSGLPLSTPGYHAVAQGPDWVSGGNWGPEGGAIATVVLAAFIIWGVRLSSLNLNLHNFNHDRMARSSYGAN